MPLPDAVSRAADELLSALRDTEALREYRRLHDEVMADEVNRRLIQRYARAQTALQMAAMAGAEPREEDTTEFERLNALLYQSDEVTQYLLSQMRAQQLVAETLHRLTAEVGLDVDIRES